MEIRKREAIARRPRGQVLDENHWFTKQIIEPLIVHAPKHVIGSRDNKRILPSVIQNDVDVDIVVVRIAFS
jgi:hypothetical protein